MRLSRDQWAMELVATTAKRGTCLRRQVGCVLLDARGHVLSTGYNGVAAGVPHCNENVQPVYGRPPTVADITKAFPHACPGAHAVSGTQLDACHAIHAEQNALLQCRDVYQIHTVYVTSSPCMTCTKLLLNTSCERVVFAEAYAHDATARELWTGFNRTWEQLK